MSIKLKFWVDNEGQFLSINGGITQMISKQKLKESGCGAVGGGGGVRGQRFNNSEAFIIKTTFRKVFHVILNLSL